MKKTSHLLVLFSTLLFSTISFAQQSNMEELAKLGAGYHAKNMCTCLFVVEQTEEFCKEMSQTSPNINELGGKYLIDFEKKTVTAKLLVIKTTAAWQDARLGCLILPNQ